MKPRPMVVAGVVSSVGLIYALFRWLEWHGYFVSPDAIYVHILAKSFWAHPYVIWFKRAFSFKYEIIHHDFNFPPLMPLMHWALGELGLTSWQRGNWTTAIFMGLIPAGWMWALAPQLKDDKRIVAGAWFATILMFGMATNQIWHELYLGIVSPLVVLLFVLAYGMYVRGRYVACGVINGFAFLTRFDAQMTMAIFVIAHLASQAPSALGLPDWRSRKAALKKVALECAMIVVPFLLVTAVWWVRAVALGHKPWFNHMVPIWLYGEAGNFRWFPDTDTALGHPIYPGRAFEFYEKLIRDRWADLVNPYFGPFMGELASMGVLLFLGLMYAIHRPEHRALMAIIWLGGALRLALIAGLHDSFNRRYFIIFDAGVFTWLALMLFDRNRLLRIVAVAVAASLLHFNWPELQNVAMRSMRPYVGYLEANSPGLSSAVAEVNVTKQPVLTPQIVGHAVAYYTNHIPVIEMPTNWRDEGIMDAFLERWKIKWLTNPDDVRPYSKRFSLVEHKASNGYSVWEVQSLPKTTPQTPAQ